MDTLLYQKAEERLRILVGSGRYKIIKRYQREDKAWPHVYLLIEDNGQSTFHFFTRQRVG